MVEVGMAVQKSIQTMVVAIIRYMLYPYCFSSNGILVKSLLNLLGKKSVEDQGHEE